MKVKLITLVLAICFTVPPSLCAKKLSPAEYREAYHYVLAHQSTDAYFTESKQRVLEYLEGMNRKYSLPKFELVIAWIPQALKGDMGVFYTAACSSILPKNLKPIILCNENYLYEIEAATRGNEMASVYNTEPIFLRDASIYSFIRNAMPDPRMLVLQMRADAISQGEPGASTYEEHIMLHLTQALLFFAGHELGHLQEHHQQASLLSIFEDSDALQENIETAVVRMCRHGEEFWNEGNGLGGYDWVKDRNSNIRKIEQKYRSLSVRFANADDWYIKEKEADQFSIKILLSYLEKIYEQNSYEGIKTQYYLIETLHSIGIYSMYRDLTTLADRICSFSISHSSQLSLCMAMNREQYIKASSIFSDVHRPILLRSLTVIGDLLEAREEFSGLSPEDRTKVVTEDEYKKLLASKNYRKLELRMWYTQSWQRLVLQDILLDTNVKLTMHACASGWISEIDKKRGKPQGFFMNFESMEDAIRRLLKFLGM